MKWIVLLIFLVLSVQPAVAVDVSQGTIFRTRGSNCDYVMANNFTFTNITVYNTTLNINGGNITTYSSSNWLDMSLEVLQPSTINFTNNITAANMTIENGFGNFTIVDGINVWIEDQINGTLFQSQTPSGGMVIFTSIPPSSWSIYTNDSIAPLIEMDTNTLNATSYFKSPIKVNYTVTDENINRTWYNVTNMTAVIVSNTTITGNTTFNVTTDGEYTLVVYADDKACNVNKTNITFRVDTTAPTITNIVVSDTSVLVDKPITISCDVNDSYAGVSKVMVCIEDPKASLTNYTLSHSIGDTYTFTYLHTTRRGTYYIRYFYAWDNVTDSNFKDQVSSLKFNVVGGGGGDITTQRDTDGDGISDISEMLAGTDWKDPCDPNPNCGACLAIKPSSTLTPVPTLVPTPTVVPQQPPSVPITPKPTPEVIEPPTEPKEKSNLLFYGFCLVLVIIVFIFIVYRAGKRAIEREEHEK